MLSNLCHLQWTALVDNRSMLIGSCVALVAIATESTALYDSCISFVVLHEVFETVSFSGISLDALHDTLTADGAVVRNIVVHAGVRLRAEYASVVHVASFVNIHDVAIAVVEDQMAPAYAMHLAGKLKVVVPAERLGSVEFKNVSVYWSDGLPDDPRENIENAKLASGKEQMMPLKVAIREFFKRSDEEAETWIQALEEDLQKRLQMQMQPEDPNHPGPQDGKGVNPNKKGSETGLTSFHSSTNGEA